MFTEGHLKVIRRYRCHLRGRLDRLETVVFLLRTGKRLLSSTGHCAVRSFGSWNVKLVSVKLRPEHSRNNNRGVCEVVIQDAHSARRVLGDRGMSEAELLEKERIVAK